MNLDASSVAKACLFWILAADRRLTRGSTDPEETPQSQANLSALRLELEPDQALSKLA